MKKIVFVLGMVCVSCAPAPPAGSDGDLAAWQRQAQAVTIIRDDWGIPHVYGKTDADVVFGVMYAQAEDDFNRVETNYLNAMGRLAEAEGESAVYRDLRMKLFIAPDDLKAKFDASPDWLKALMRAYAAGLNYYLHTHPDVRPRVITRFEPWMALSFTEGSIGGDIERINLTQLERFYAGVPPQLTRLRAGGASARQAHPAPAADTSPDADRVIGPDAEDREPRGSNGIAIAPSNTASGKALLLINPHTSFFFRAEAQMVSEEGLNAYGALTWGQFFVYQGFNDRAGWMHTSSGVDNIDEYLETIVKKGDAYFYRYGAEERPVTATRIAVPYKTASGPAQKEFTVYRTHHGPIVREADGKWVSVRLMQEPIKALTQSYSRTKAKSYKAFRESMDFHTNSSNNTIYADADGSIAYFHSNFIPRRDVKFDWTRPVDGSDPATEWNGVHSIDETPGLLNPASGWLYNTNNWPWSAAGASSQKKADFPVYVERNSENARGLHAIEVLDNRKGFTIDSLIAAAYDSHLTAFDALIPPLLNAYDRPPASDLTKQKVAEQIALLRAWDRRWGVDSVATTMAIAWADDLDGKLGTEARKQGIPLAEYLAQKAPPQVALQALASAADRLTADYGSWKTPWGEVNRFQRLTGDIVQPFDDAGPSIPVGFTSGTWGSLASFGARQYKGTKKIYGTSGNSFVAVVEFGDRVRARAVSAGGQSGDPKSPHFNDQAMRYSKGDLRDVYFYRDQLEGHTEEQYRPGEARKSAK